MDRSVRRIWLPIILLLSCLFISCSTNIPKDYLKEGFLNPPDTARPGVYWYFMDGNLDRDAMTKDLESMKKAGIGYALFLEVNVGVPRGKVDFLSEEWQDLFKHAVKESERLGIRIILGSGPGWAGSGGPWVTPAQSMQHLVSSDTTIAGPTHFSGHLKLPEPKKPFFGENSLTKSLKEKRDAWYEDVFVLAFPSPAGKSRIDNIDEKALYYRAPYTSQPGVVPFFTSGISSKDDENSIIRKNEIEDLTGRLDINGKLEWDVPPGKWTIMRFVKRNNGAVTRPAPAPGLGFEADKFDTVSFDAHYNAYVGKLIKKVNPVKSKNGGGWTMIHIDSWEMGSQNWTNDFREQFRRRRGYDPMPYLPVYKGFIVNSSEMSERFLWDIRQTSNELIVENHAGRFKDLGQRNGFRLSIEPYDMNPASDFDLGSVADIPMCEFWSDRYGFNSSFSCIEATSIAHVKGVPVVAAESFTADHSEAWKKYPGDMKNQGDWAFCMGINRLIYHTFAHKPFPDKYRPGMTMGPYGVHWDRGQTWWNMADAYHKYITRCQYILSQGRAVADILFVTPEGAPQVFLPPESSLDGSAVMPDKKGYSFDGCSPSFLIKYASVKDKQIVFPGGASYRILVLPRTRTMTPELTSAIMSLVNAGAIVVGNPPHQSPSLTDYPQCDRKVRVISDSLWGVSDIPEGLIKRNFGKGTIWFGSDLVCDLSYNSTKENPGDLYPFYSQITSILENNQITPDFSASGNIRYTHRSLADRDIYFISNRSDSMVTDTCLFRNGTQNAEVWDAVSGRIYKTNLFSSENGRTALPIKLEPYQSFFIMFYHSSIPGNVKPQETLLSGDYQIIKTLDGPWNVFFDTLWGGPENIRFDSLSDWASRPEEGIRYYSGTATYSKSFEFSDQISSSGKSDIFLDLGKVRNLARVKLNGNELGVVWTAPWQVRITDHLKNSNNQLEIEVANLWVNRLVGDESQPWDGVKDGKWPEWLLNGTRRESKRFTFTTHHFYKKNDQLSESGLIGPVTIKIAR